MNQNEIIGLTLIILIGFAPTIERTIHNVHNWFIHSTNNTRHNALRHYRHNNRNHKREEKEKCF